MNFIHCLTRICITCQVVISTELRYCMPHTNCRDAEHENLSISTSPSHPLPYCNLWLMAWVLLALRSSSNSSKSSLLHADVAALHWRISLCHRSSEQFVRHIGLQYMQMTISNTYASVRLCLPVKHDYIPGSKTCFISYTHCCPSFSDIGTCLLCFYDR